MKIWINFSNSCLDTRSVSLTGWDGKNLIYPSCETETQVSAKISNVTFGHVFGLYSSRNQLFSNQQQKESDGPRWLGDTDMKHCGHELTQTEHVKVKHQRSKKPTPKNNTIPPFKINFIKLYFTFPPTSHPFFYSDETYLMANELNH